jgi:hypothetical protein
MNMAIDNYFNSSYKTWFLLPKKRKYQPKSFGNAMIENKKEEK